jgi:hypothetical protein
MTAGQNASNGVGQNAPRKIAVGHNATCQKSAKKNWHAVTRLMAMT